jgi:hypothetical protein
MQIADPEFLALYHQKSFWKSLPVSVKARFFTIFGPPTESTP